MLLKQFLSDTLSVLEADFCEPLWQRSGYLVEICQTYANCPTTKLSGRERDQMKFKLGMETVTAINDGGLGIRYNIGNGFVDWQPGGIRPVLSLEVPSLLTIFDNS